MQHWFRRKELVSRPYDKCGIFAKQYLEFHAGDLIGSEHRHECLNCEAHKLGASHGQGGSNPMVRLADNSRTLRRLKRVDSLSRLNIPDVACHSAFRLI